MITSALLACTYVILLTAIFWKLAANYLPFSYIWTQTYLTKLKFNVGLINFIQEWHYWILTPAPGSGHRWNFLDRPKRHLAELLDVFKLLFLSLDPLLDQQSELPRRFFTIRPIIRLWWISLWGIWFWGVWFYRWRVRLWYRWSWWVWFSRWVCVRWVRLWLVSPFLFRWILSHGQGGNSKNNRKQSKQRHVPFYKFTQIISRLPLQFA